MISPLTALKRVPVKLLRVDSSGTLERVALRCYLVLKPHSIRALWRLAVLLEKCGKDTQAVHIWEKIYLLVELSDRKRSRAALDHIVAYCKRSGRKALGLPIAGLIDSPSDWPPANIGSVISEATGVAIPAPHLVGHLDTIVDDGNATRVYWQALQPFIEGSLDETALQKFWTEYDAKQDQLRSSTVTRLQAITLEFGKIALRHRRPEIALHVVSPAYLRWSRIPDVLRLMARANEYLGNWKLAVTYWQFLCAVADQTSDKHPALKGRATKYSRALLANSASQLRISRIGLAKYYRREGNIDGFSETVSRIVESLPDHQSLKVDPDILNLVVQYVQDRLDIEPDKTPHSVPELHKLVVCLDVIKLSAVHNHARTIFSICGRLLESYPALKIHVIATQERLAVSRPILNSSYYPPNERALGSLARKLLGADFGQRVTVEVCQEPGLTGIVDVCNRILRERPDVVLYGGGHRGLFSNESRLVRNALYPHVATAFFYMQSNNIVDDKMDVILARGPHEVLGDKGRATIVIQPYPTFVPSVAPENAAPKRPTRNGRKQVIVSALVGYRRFRNTLQKIPETDLKRILRILDDNPRSVWYFVGIRYASVLMFEVPALARYVLAGRIRARPVLPADQYARFVGSADLFLHLPGFTGGSGGAAVARRQAVPILTFSHSDVSGRQPPETVFADQDIDAFCEQANRILSDAEFAKNIAHTQFEHSQRLHKTATLGFYEALMKSSQIFQSRNK